MSRVRSWVLPEVVSLFYSIFFLVLVRMLVMKDERLLLARIVRPALVLVAGPVNGYIHVIRHDADLLGGLVRRSYLL